MATIGRLREEIERSKALCDDRVQSERRALNNDVVQLQQTIMTLRTKLEEYDEL
jgi:hypothetical protein